MNPRRVNLGGALAIARYLAGLSQVMVMVLVVLLTVLVINWAYGLSTGE